MEHAGDGGKFLDDGKAVPVGFPIMDDHRQIQLRRRRMRHRQRNAENRIRAELLLGRRAVELDHRLVDADLVERFHPLDFGEDLLVDVLDRLEHALAAVTLLVAVAQFKRLVFAGGRPRRNCRRPGRTGFQLDLHLDGGVAAGVQNLSGVDLSDFRHDNTSSLVVRSPEQYCSAQ